MYTADVKLVRHQQSFAKFTYACPNQALRVIFITSGWEVQPTVQFHWSKIPVLLAVCQTSNAFRSKVILFLQTLIVVLFLHQRVRTVSLSPAACPWPTRPLQMTAPVWGPLAPSLRPAQRPLHQTPVRKIPLLLELHPFLEKRRRKKKRTVWPRSLSGRPFYAPPYDPCHLSAGTAGDRAKIQQGRQRLVSAGMNLHSFVT